jgi:hypothetical protein
MFDKVDVKVGDVTIVAGGALGSGRWDECCPHCGKKLDVYSAWQAREYPDDEFEFECCHCEKLVQVYVHAVPEFELHKKEVKPTLTEFVD